MSTWLNPQRDRSERPLDAPARGFVEVRVAGALTLFTVAEQERAILAALRNTADDVLFDLRAVTYASAVGVRMLDYLRSLTADAGRRLVLVVDTPEVLRQLRINGLTALVDVYRTPIEARQSQTGRSRGAMPSPRVAPSRKHGLLSSSVWGCR